jgi:hypothetical protein
MSKVRPDTNISVTFNKSGGSWGNFQVTFQEVTDDGVFSPSTIVRSLEFPISDLPAPVKASLQDAWDGMKAWRDQENPIS